MAKTGFCALCGKNKKLSFEHVPPRSALNDKPIFIQTFDHLFDEKNRVYGKKMTSNRGFGGYTLCETCNNNTGDWYAKDFADFAQQGMRIISSLEEPVYAIKGSYQIKPLNVLKQILTMFMSADKSGHLRAQEDLVGFILNKDISGLPSRFRIFLYSTLSTFKRMHGIVFVDLGNRNYQTWAEINFQPFGYLLAQDSDPAHKDMCDISKFGGFKYDERVKFEITTPYLNVMSPIIGVYQ